MVSLKEEKDLQQVTIHHQSTNKRRRAPLARPEIVECGLELRFLSRKQFCALWYQMAPVGTPIYACWRTICVARRTSHLHRAGNRRVCASWCQDCAGWHTSRLHRAGNRRACAPVGAKIAPVGTHRVRIVPRTVEHVYQLAPRLRNEAAIRATLVPNGALSGLWTRRRPT